MDHLAILREILSDQFQIEPECITANTRIIQDLGADSIDLEEIGLAIEDHYGIDSIPEDIIFTTETVSQLISFLEAT